MKAFTDLALKAPIFRSWNNTNISNLPKLYIKTSTSMKKYETECLSVNYWLFLNFNEGQNYNCCTGLKIEIGQYIALGN